MEYKRGTTSLIILLRAYDTASTSGAGKTGLAYDTATLAASYFRNKAATAVDITLATMTLGTWVSGGFKEVDAVRLPGLYALCLPDAALAVGDGSTELVVQLRGVDGAYFPPVQINLTAADFTDVVDIEAKTNLIGTSGASLPLPPSAETITLYLGTVYAVADGTAYRITSDSPLNWASAALEFGGHALPVAVSGVAGAWVFSVEMSEAAQASLVAGDYSYTLVPRLSGKSYDSPPISAGTLKLVANQ